MLKIVAIVLVALGIAGCEKNETVGQSAQQNSAATSPATPTGDAAVKSMYGNIKTNSLR